MLCFAGCVHALLTAGASIDQPMSNPSRQHSELPVVNGCTALHLAADCGHTAIAALLLHAHVGGLLLLLHTIFSPGALAVLYADIIYYASPQLQCWLVRDSFHATSHYQTKALRLRPTERACNVSKRGVWL